MTSLFDIDGSTKGLKRSSTDEQISLPFTKQTRKILLDRVGEMQAPMQLWYGAEDQSIPPEEHGRIAEAMTAANKRYTMNVIPNVGHGYFCEDRESYNEAATKESWDAMLALFRACTA